MKKQILLLFSIFYIWVSTILLVNGQSVQSVQSIERLGRKCFRGDSSSCMKLENIVKDTNTNLEVRLLAINNIHDQILLMELGSECYNNIQIAFNCALNLSDPIQAMRIMSMYSKNFQTTYSFDYTVLSFEPQLAKYFKNITFEKREQHWIQRYKKGNEIVDVNYSGEALTIFANGIIIYQYLPRATRSIWANSLGPSDFDHGPDSRFICGEVLKKIPLYELVQSAKYFFYEPLRVEALSIYRWYSYSENNYRKEFKILLEDWLKIETNEEIRKQLVEQISLIK